MAESKSTVKKASKRAEPKVAPMAKRRDGTIVLRASAEDEIFTTLDVVAGLCGVCEALHDTVGTDSMDRNTIQRLSLAAHVLSLMVAARVEIP